MPVWIGGNTPAAHRRVVRFGNAFHAAFEPLSVVSEQWAQIQAECVRVGRDPKELRLSLRVFLDPAGAMPPDKSIQGTADEMLARIAELKAIGVDHVLLDPVARGGPQARMDAIRAFMENIAPHA
ncbi:MAG: alkanesulfonate monooxygenase SsuD [Gammaproteobacteria bacterium]